MVIAELQGRAIARAFAPPAWRGVQARPILRMNLPPQASSAETPAPSCCDLTVSVKARCKFITPPEKMTDAGQFASSKIDS
jgi:hypothetical protein